MIRYKCSHCRCTIETTDDMAGTVEQCPDCGGRNRLAHRRERASSQKSTQASGHGKHEWQFDPRQSRYEFDILVSVCTKCGCTRILHCDTFLAEYKPYEWTLNPFKTLKTEPPCPAHW